MLLLSTGLLALGGWWWWQRRDQRDPAAARLTLAPRITDPQRQGRALGQVWQLHSRGCRCELARRLEGRRLDIDEAVPLSSCGAPLRTCTCTYRPLPDRRRGARRERSDRRDALRFDLSAAERRQHGGRRRSEQAWQLACER